MEHLKPAISVLAAEFGGMGEFVALISTTERNQYIWGILIASKIHLLMGYAKMEPLKPGINLVRHSGSRIL